jgi:hypothetical protein
VAAGAGQSQESQTSVDGTARQLLRISSEKRRATFGKVAVLAGSGKISGPQTTEGNVAGCTEIQLTAAQAVIEPANRIATSTRDGDVIQSNEKSPGFPRGFPQPIL